MVPGWRLVLPVAFFARRVRLSMLLSVFQYLSVPGRSDCAGGRPPALFLHSAGRLGETPRPSLVSLLAACVHRPGLFVTCSGRVWRGRRGWVQPWVRVLFFPGRPRRFGYPYFAPRGAYGRFSALPVVWGASRRTAGPSGRRGGRLGLFPRGAALPLRCRLAGLSRDGPILLPEARRGVLPPSRWIGGVWKAVGRSGLHRGLAGGAFPRGSPLPVAPSWVLSGMGLFRPQRRVQAFCRPPGIWRVQEGCGAVRPAQRLPPGGAGGRFPLFSPPVFLRPYIKGKKINRSV